MLICLDCRERSLIAACKSYIERNSNLENNIRLITENLPIGDIIIKDFNENEKLIIERKTINDLASSIRDNRYNEQSFRLSECNLHNHYIYYLIEGSLSSLNTHSRVNRASLLSAMTSLSYFKGFSIHRTMNVNETAEWLIRTADKLRRETKTPYYRNTNTNNHTGDHIGNDVSDSGENNEGKRRESYSSVSKREKKNNITTENIGEIMLMQIPGVSVASAQCIMAKYGNIQRLIKILEDNPQELDTIVTMTKTGKERKLNKTTKNNIYEYLIQNV